MTLPCEFCGAPVRDWPMAERGFPACCHECSWVPALVVCVALLVLGGIIYVITRSLYG